MNGKIESAIDQVLKEFRKTSEKRDKAEAKKVVCDEAIDDLISEDES